MNTIIISGMGVICAQFSLKTFNYHSSSETVSITAN